MNRRVMENAHSDISKFERTIFVVWSNNVNTKLRKSHMHLIKHKSCFMIRRPRQHESIYIPQPECELIIQGGWARDAPPMVDK